MNARNVVSDRTPESESEIALAFDADVSVSEGGRSLYLIVGSASATSIARAAVTRADGEVAAEFGDGRLLAVLTASGFSQLQADVDIALVGPVTLDPTRFETFVRLLGIDDPVGVT
ncbi:MAG: hypothetical protein M3092_00960 [Actinomycetia bacterium]|nr:hypothetical protein [Actinomycetes bacterium]